ncbi:MAG TPA: response regulator transcription factor [Jiangellaceae bacterium]
MITVLIADDDELVRAGLRLIIGSDQDLAVVGEAADGQEAINLARALRPDVVLMDVKMPGLDGLEATRSIVGGATESGPRVLILTTFELDEYVFGALRAGASGFLLKRSSPEVLIEGIKVVATGAGLLSPTVTRRLIEEFAHQPGPPNPPHASVNALTQREREVLSLVGAGLSNRELAARLFISEATVKTHIRRIMMKLGLRDRVQAVVLAYEAGLVQAQGRRW